MEENTNIQDSDLGCGFSKNDTVSRQLSFVDPAFSDGRSISTAQLSSHSIKVDEEIEEEENVSTNENGKTIWQTIEEEFENDRREIEEYKVSKRKDCDVPDIPIVKYMEENILHLLTRVMQETFTKALETESLKYQKSPFNGLDHMAQLLWNYNPAHLERLEQNLFIHDMDWVKEYLAENPRPYFPLSWIFTKDIAATKIQAFMRGYWVRRRDDVQEMRQFWKEIQKEPIITNEENISIASPKFRRAHDT